MGEDVVVEEKNGKWNRVWVPLFAKGAAHQGQVRVLVKTFHINNQMELDRFGDRQTLTGVIDNVIPGHSLGSGEIEELKKKYPSVDAATILVIEEGRTFPTQEKVYLLFGGGIGLVVVGLAAGLVLLVAKLGRRTG